MFKIGIYSKQLTAICFLLAVIVLQSAWKAFVTPAHAAPTVQQPITDHEIETIVESDYQLNITDNGEKVVLMDGLKPVYVFDRREHPNCELFKQIDRDNE